MTSAQVDDAIAKNAAAGEKLNALKQHVVANETSTVNIATALPEAKAAHDAAAQAVAALS